MKEVLQSHKDYIFGISIEDGLFAIRNDGLVDKTLLSYIRKDQPIPITVLTIEVK